MNLNISTFIHILVVNYHFILFYFHFHPYLVFSSRNLLSMVDIGFFIHYFSWVFVPFEARIFLGAFRHLNAQRNNLDGQHLKFDIRNFEQYQEYDVRYCKLGGTLNAHLAMMASFHASSWNDTMMSVRDKNIFIALMAKIHGMWAFGRGFLCLWSFYVLYRVAWSNVLEPVAQVKGPSRLHIIALLVFQQTNNDVELE